MSSAGGISEAYTCLACRYAFPSAEAQRNHYKTDWHRYNLKRKVAGLESVTAENFRQRVLQQQALVAAEQQDTSFHCKACSKVFASENTYQNHLASKKHREGEAKYQEKEQARQLLQMSDQNDAETMNESSSQPKSQEPATKPHQHRSIREGDGDEDGDEDEEEEFVPGKPLALGDCIFCRESFPDLTTNLEHMSLKHSFFIPNLDALKDLEGLIKYLQEKVGQYYVCLICNERGRPFRSLQAVRAHMSQKGHCMVDTSEDGCMELEEYYNVEWEDLDDDDDDDDDDEGDDDHVAKPSANSGENYQVMVLGNGAVLGHRSLTRFYKQKFRREDTRESVLINKLMSQYKAIGYDQSSAPEVMVKMRKARDAAKRRQQIDSAHLGVRHNMMHQYFK